MNRRSFAVLAGAAAIPLRGKIAPTAQDVVRRIQTSLGGEWPETGLDGFKAGRPHYSGQGHRNHRDGHGGCSEAGVEGRDEFGSDL